MPRECKRCASCVPGRHVVELPEAAQGKNRQKYRRGSDDWIREYVRRTYVEAGFGELRNPALGAHARGKFAVIGIIKVTLMLAALVAASNARRLVAWAQRTGIVACDPA